jgi:hypothetical protein
VISELAGGTLDWVAAFVAIESCSKLCCLDGSTVMLK